MTPGAPARHIPAPSPALPMNMASGSRLGSVCLAPSPAPGGRGLGRGLLFSFFSTPRVHSLRPTPAVYFPILPLAFLLSLQACAAQATPPDRPGWTLVWHDEFDGPALDPDKWRVEYAALVKNQELQFYTDDEVYIEDGCLVLRSRKRDYGGRAYTSGLVDTQHRFAQAFGRFEVRAKLPAGQGIWPAHWMLPEDHPAWPPEIDVMEALGHEPDTVHLTHHWGTYPNNASRGVPHKGPDFSADFHTFAIEWSPERIDWFIDDAPVYSSTADIPQIPFYLILNTAVGGHWPGNPDDNTVFPQHHRIDHVRVYERADAGRPMLQTRSHHGRIVLDPPRHVFEQGESVTARAEPDFGYRFVGWDDQDAEPGEITLTMDRPRTLVARFEPDPDLPPRLTDGVRASATSVEGPGLGPELAIDGLPGTRWASAHSEPQSLTLDLGAPARVERVRITWENAFASEFVLWGSIDGEVWSEVRRVQKPHASPDILQGPTDPVRFLRLDAIKRGTPWGVSVWEFEVYGRRVPGG